MKKRKCILSVDVEALPTRAKDHHVDTLIFGKSDKKDLGIGYMMDVADKHNIKMTFFVNIWKAERVLRVFSHVMTYLFS